MEEIIRLILESKLLDAGVDAATKQSILIGGMLAPLFFLANCVWNYATTTIKNLGVRPQFFDKSEMIRAGVLWFILTVGYIPIFGSVAYMGEMLGRWSISNSPTVENGKKKFNDIAPNELKKEAEQKNSEEASDNAETKKDQVSDGDSWSIGSMLTTGVNTFIFGAFSAGTVVVSSIIRIVVEAFALMISKLFYAIGPIVLAFSILPVFKDKINQWFGVYLNCLFVPFTCNLLDTIYYSIIDKGLQGEFVANPVALSCFNLVFIICYCLVFWVTSFYAGSSGGGKVLSTAVGAATSLVSMGGSMLAAKAAGAAASSGGNNIIENSANATDTAK